MPVPEVQLKKKLSEAAKSVKVGGLYKHYKGKNYKVLNLALNEVDLEVCVIYQAEYGQKLTFIRAIDVWLEEVEYHGSKIKRFTLIG